MPERLNVTINGVRHEFAQGTTIAAATLLATQPSRISVSGTPRAPLCGMGICFECRATVDGVPHQRTCQMLCKEGMNVETGR